MNSFKNESSNNNKLYGSSVMETRNKASSLYNKRPTYNVPDLQISGNYLSPHYQQTDRIAKGQESGSRLAMSYVGKIDQNYPKNKYESYNMGRGSSYRDNEPKSATRVNNSSTKIQTSENANMNDILANKKRQVDKKIEAIGSNQNGDNFKERIIERMSKKQKIIEELQRLSETKISDNLRNKNGYEKGDYQVYSPVRVSKNANNETKSGFKLEVVPSNQNDKLAVPTSNYNNALTQSLNFDVKRNDFQSKYLSSPQQHMPVRKGSHTDRNSKKQVEEMYVPCRKSSHVDRESHKYQEEVIPVRKSSYTDRDRGKAEAMKSKDSYRNVSTAYNTPKQSSSRSRASQQFDYAKEKTKMDSSKKYNIFDSFGNDSYKTKDMTYSSRLGIPETTNLSEIYTRKSKQFEDGKDQKQTKDIRQVFESKSIKNNSGYFSEKKSLSVYDFQLKKSLGEGKFGQVYQAFHKDTNSLYALKKISKKVIKTNMMIDQLLQEIKIQAYCNHENILKLYGFFDDSENIYLILEYMEQGTLFSNLKQQKTLKQQDVKFKIKDIAKAVVYLHEEGIVHRDIKPENIVMSNNVCKLCDFGWAAICTDRRKTYCGTFDYVAPEILEGVEYDVSVDLWCLGVLAYELLVGKAPFYHISRKQTMKKIMKVQKLEYPSNISQTAIFFIDSLIKKNPEDRLNGQDILRHPFLSEIKETIV